MGLEVDASDLDPANLPAPVEGGNLYRYGGSFYTGEQEAVILELGDHRKKSAPEGSAPSSIRVVVGLDGQPTTDGTPPKVRFDEYIGLGKDRFSSEKRINLIRTLQPELAVKGGTFDYARHVGKRVLVLIEEEDEGGEYGVRPRVTRFVRVLDSAPKTAQAPAAQGNAQRRPAQAAAAAAIPEDQIPF